jgi:hypothetical protein
MRYYEAESAIAASPADVWAVLADGSAWPTWDSGVDAVEGRFAAGERVTVRSAAAPGRAFPVRVTEWEPGRRIALAGGMPLGLFRGVRTFTLKPSGTGTDFRVREEYSGPLLRLIWRSMPDLAPSFRQFADGLKRRVEHG